MLCGRRPAQLQLPTVFSAAVTVVLQGAGTQEFMKLMQKHFKKVARMRVDASRSMSREFYAIGLGRKGQ